MERTYSLTVRLSADSIKALEAMVELGTADRREFLTRYASENDWSDEDIAQGHYETDCAEEAVRHLQLAMTNALHKPASYLLKVAEKGENAFWSDEHGWTTEGLADHFTAEQTVLSARRDVLLSLGLEAEFVPAPEHNTDGSGWVIYSRNEAATGNGGFWNLRKGWVHREDATWYPSCLAGSYSLPQSLGQDRRWLNLHLCGITSEEGLSAALRTFCTNNDIPPTCAAELLASQQTLSTANRLWLEQFCRQWDAAVDA